MRDENQAMENGAGCSSGEMNLETESKFAITVDTEGRVVQAGGTCVNHVSFHDAYFDTDSFQLTLADHWLRRRDGKWELKVPLVDRSKQNKPETYTKYLEFDDEKNIIANLSAILLTYANDPDEVKVADDNCMDTNLEKWLKMQNLNLKPFADFTTKRKTFSMNGGISIVLDETNFGFNVGEVEVMSSQSGDDVKEAEMKINEMVEKIG
ncbi:thiamine-triphosphatase-like [Asterias rubens]|uniref:thiamine-triphosphatase-like n=1 Tax=Asterias rubens TaxID=7604 RepID=UPI001454EBAB|nr:thiamine-triphosphatase-like [Asterias rubens]